MFISFEGGDGAGKTTQLARLADWLRGRGYEPLVTREPGGTALGRTLRELVLHGEEMSARTEALLYAADRGHHVETVIRPALANGRVVLTDRYLDSSVAYQGVGRGLGAARIEDLNVWAVGGLLPDLTILLDLDPVHLASRLQRDLDRLERAGDEFHRATRAAFLDRAAAAPERFVIVDAAASPEEVGARVRRAVAERLGEQP